MNFKKILMIFSLLIITNCLAFGEILYDRDLPSRQNKIQKAQNKQSFGLFKSYGSIEDDDETDLFPQPGTGGDRDGAENDAPVHEALFFMCGLGISYLLRIHLQRRKSILG